MGDHPLFKTGVGIQSYNTMAALCKSGHFCIRSVGGNVPKDSNIKPGIVEPFGEDFKVIPTEKYGSPELLKALIRTEKPDLIWIMTDPRYWTWLWEIEDEIRVNVPIVYYHVWDNYPYPSYNEAYYDSNDAIASISKLTEDVVETVAKKVRFKKYIPHAVDTDKFKPLPQIDLDIFKSNVLPMIKDDRKVFFYNSRNARRKQTGSLLFWFHDFLKKNPGAAHLVMRTDLVDNYGTDLGAIIRFLKLTKDVSIINQRVTDEDLAKFYNVADVTINVSDAEGFGLSTLESLACGTPIIATLTGGLQDQLQDEDGNWYGIGLKPRATSVIGHPDTPWVYEDKVSGEDVIRAMETISSMSREEIKQWGMSGRTNQVMKNFNFEDFNRNWVEFMLQVHQECGSWPNKNYEPYEFIDVFGEE